VLAPLGLSLDDCAATNAIKCHTSLPPEVLGSKRTKTLYLACFDHLSAEVAAMRPALCISLSKRIATLLDPSIDFRRDFAALRVLRIGTQNVPWIAVPHIPKSNLVRAAYAALGPRLAALRGTIPGLP
jgi:hypothetical protein